MHNSNNSALSKDIFTGTLLAQAKLLGISTNINNCTTEELEEIVTKNTDLKIHVIPNFSKPEVQNHNVSQSLVKYLEKQSCTPLMKTMQCEADQKYLLIK